MSYVINRRVTTLFKDLSFDISIICRDAFVLSWPYRMAHSFQLTTRDFSGDKFSDKNLLQVRAFVLAMQDLSEHKLNVSPQNLPTHALFDESLDFITNSFVKHKEELQAGIEFPEEFNAKIDNILDVLIVDSAHFICIKREQIRQQFNSLIKDSYEFFTDEEIENIVREEFVLHVLER